MIERRRLVPCLVALLVSLMGPPYVLLQATAVQQGEAPALPNESLPRGAKLYVAPIENGFDTYIIAGLQNKSVPVVVVTIRDKADYELTGVSESDKAGWAKMLFLKSTSSAEIASVKVVNIKTGSVVFAYSVSKGNSMRGKQSAGEAVAKHIKEKIESK